MFDIDLTLPHDYEVAEPGDFPGSGEFPFPLLHFPPPGPTRNGLWIKVTPANGKPWIGIFASDYNSPPAFSRVISLFDPNRVCVIADGAGYVVTTDEPTIWEPIPVVPVLGVQPVREHGLIVFSDFTRLAAYGENGLAWRSPQLCWDELKIQKITDSTIEGTGYDPTNSLTSESRFVIDIKSGRSLLAPPKMPKVSLFGSRYVEVLYNYLVAFFRNLKITLEMIKWEHSIFALPFALCGAMLAAGGIPAWRPLLWIVVAMISARSAAMAFNRLADASIDAANPRTAVRALPLGQLSPSFVTTFVLVSCGIFVLAASQLNRLTLMLSPIALAIALLYSYTKRFTRWSHLFLGLALGIAPTAAWIAVRGSIDPRILLLTAAVMFWVGGFDIIYACQDRDFDQSYGLHSLPRHIGIKNALIVARVFHIVMIGLLIALVVVFGLGKLAMMGIVAVAGLLLYEHALVRHDDLSKLNAAFFTMNGVIAVVFFLFVAGDLLVRI